MGKIERYDVNEEWAHSGIIKAGDFCYLGYCVGNIGGTIEEQINGANKPGRNPRLFLLTK